MNLRSAPSRRDVLATLAGLPLAALPGCVGSAPRLPDQGEFVGPNVEGGHRLRDDRPPRPSHSAWRDVGVLIVGAGIAGLSAARRLTQAGFDDFMLCELESTSGGTSSSSRSALTAYPWGAHYLPVPLASNESLIDLLVEMGVVVGRDAAHEPVVAEEFLCRVPQERLFVDGTWRADLDPLATAPAAERAQAAAFEAEVDRWVAWRDGSGRRAFALPIDTGSDDAELRHLDQQTMSEWLDAHGWTSPRLRWLIDYSCRDDYGLTVDQTSAWAGLFYAASRKKGPGQPAQPLLTWPEGNGRVVDHLYRRVSPHVRLDTLVCRVEPESEDEHADEQLGCRVVTQQVPAGEVVGWRARRVIFAAPQFVARRVIDGYGAARGTDIDQFQYGSWLVANLHLRSRPDERGVALAWDNVLYDSPSLGYVTATHQVGSDYGPTIWTYYLPFCGSDPRQERQRLYELTWADAAELVLADLERAHPDLRPLVQRLDVKRWGHAMIRPTPGFVTGAARRRAAQPWRGVHFAHTELSGVALLEEAFAQGRRAAEEVLGGLSTGTLGTAGPKRKSGFSWCNSLG